MVHNKKIWCRLVRHLSKSRKKSVDGKARDLDFAEFGPVEKDPWPTPVSSEASSEASSEYSVSDESDDESEETGAGFSEMELAIDSTEVRNGPFGPTEVRNGPGEIGPFSTIDLRLPPVHGIDTKVSVFLFPSLPGITFI